MLIHIPHTHAYLRMYVCTHGAIYINASHFWIHTSELIMMRPHLRRLALFTVCFGFKFAAADMACTCNKLRPRKIFPI